MLKLAITGCTGRMGQRVLKEANRDPNIEVVGALSRPGNLFLGQDVGVFIGQEPLDISITDNPTLAFKNADVVVDCSKPGGLETHLQEALQQNKAFVACMTGLSETHKAFLETASTKIPVLVAPNTSLGNVLLRKMAVLAAEILGPSYDVSIMEMHHRSKVDAPSGTSLSLAHALANLEHLKKSNPPYPAQSPRTEGTIECVSLRGGNVPGEHTVIFAGDKDLLKIEHRVLDPSLFAHGAILAAQWLFGRPPGLYAIDDVVGISS